MTTYVGLGLMSGSSLDGLDVCCAEFTGDLNTDIWGFRILDAHTFPYDDSWRERLTNAAELPGLELVRLHHDYAVLMGQSIETFLQQLAERDDKPGGNPDPRLDFVAALGHTVFHLPQQKLTFQLGEGEVLSTFLKCPLITNFRVKDVSLGGQGASLAGCVDRYLFVGVAVCLHLGGIANIRVREDGSAWDVCACNIVLNRLAQLQDPAATFDRDGQLASQGEIQQEVLDTLEELDYYKQSCPKSLSMQWVDDVLWPVLQKGRHSKADLARTYVEHIALRISNACLRGRPTPASPTSPSRPKQYGDNVVLITGGGTHNTFLLQKVKDKLRAAGLQLEEDMTEPETVDFKEAASVAFLGMRCMLGRPNVFPDATGASQKSISGSIHQPLNTHFQGCYPSSTHRFLFRSVSQS